MRELIIFLFSITLIWLPVQQSKAELTPRIEMAMDAHLKLRLHSTMLRTQNQLDLKLGHLRSLNLPEEKFLDAWTEEFKLITNDYLQEQMSIHSFDSKQVLTLKQQMSKLNWREFSRYFIDQVTLLKSFTRISGVGLLLVIVLTNILQIVLPFVLSAVGYSPIWAIILLKIPTTLPIIYAYQLTDNMVYKLKLTRALGGKEAYEQYKDLLNASLKSLNIKHIQDHILPLDQQGIAVIIPRPSPITQVSQLFGLRKDQLTLNTLKKFMIEQNIEDQLAWSLANDKKLNSQDRVAMLMTYFHNNLDSADSSQLRLRFSKSFTTISKDVDNWKEVSSWISETLKAQSIHDLFFHLQRMPEELRPQELTAIWDEILLPELAKNELLSYTQMRRSVSRFHAYKLQVASLDHMKMTPELKEKFFDYFQQSINTDKYGCFNTHQQVIETLLKKL